MDADSETPPNMLLYRLLGGGAWTSDGVALILHKQRLSELPAQKLEDCFGEAIRGSSNEDHEGLKKVLILLIEAGIDVYSCNIFETLEQIHTSPGMEYHYWCFRKNDPNYPKCPKHDPELPECCSLLHLEIWIEAITTCGYDADQVMAIFSRRKWPPINMRCDLRGSKYRWLTTSDEPESFAAGDFNSPVAQSKAWEVSNDLEEDDNPASSNNALFEQQDWSALEGDAAVWRT